MWAIGSIKEDYLGYVDIRIQSRDDWTHLAILSNPPTDVFKIDCVMSCFTCVFRKLFAY